MTVRRRELLAGLGGAAIVGSGGYVALASSDGAGVDPVAIDLFETRGSQGGELTVPVAGKITVVDLFATTCPPCKPALAALSEARPDAADVQYVSVTGEYIDGSTRTREDVIEWWETHGGHWPVGHDAENRLMDRLDAGAIPFTAVVDPEREITWSHTGVPDAERVRRAIATART